MTGAAGCVGHYLVRELVSMGYEVTAADLPGSDIPGGDHVRVMAADLTLQGAPERAVEGCDAVVHAAAIVDIGSDWDVLAPVNVDLTKNLYRAARSAGASHFVFFSTGSAYGPSDRPLDEDAPLLAANDYVRTKIAAEEWLRGQEGGPAVNIIRPSLIFGPRGKVLAGALATVPYLVRLFSDRMVPLTGGPRCNWVHAEDVARAAAFLVKNPQPHGSAFNVANDDPVPVGDVFAVALSAGGLRLAGPQVPYPTSAVRLLMPLVARDSVMSAVNRLAAALYRRVTRRAGIASPLTPKLDKEAFDFAVRDVIFDNSRLKRLGFHYRHPTFAEAWRQTHRWYEENAWVPGGAA